MPPSPPLISDWLRLCAEAIARNAPPLAPFADHVAERLAALLVTRLPADVAVDLIGLLPDPPAWLSSRTSPTGDASIGYPDFLRSAEDTIALAAPELTSPPERLDNLARRAADLFFAALAVHLPAGLRRACLNGLPAELGSRMLIRAA
jgi:hypothetical protein